jgi:hypothetical protein
MRLSFSCNYRGNTKERSLKNGQTTGKIVCVDYEEVVTETTKSAWQKPMKAMFICTVHYRFLDSSHVPAYENGIECSETSVYKIQAPRN